MKDDKMRLWMDDFWFNELMLTLHELRDFCSFMMEEKESKDPLFKSLFNENTELINKIIRYAWYEEKPDNIREVRVELFPSEGRKLIWQLLASNLFFSDTESPDFSYYNVYKAKHEAYKKGEISFSDEVSVSAARELYNLWRLGYVYLVKNKDGTCYAVDHGCIDVPVKAEERWEDPEYGFDDQNVFLETKHDFKIVSWDDEAPLDIGDYLIDNGWIALEGKDYIFLAL